MSLPEVSAWFLVPAVVLYLVSLLRERRGTRASRAAATGLAALVMLALTLVFDNVMIGAKLFDYQHAQLLGWYVGRAPVEDLAYALCALLVAVAVWNLLPARERTRPGERHEEREQS